MESERLDLPHEILDLAGSHAIGSVAAKRFLHSAQVAEQLGCRLVSAPTVAGPTDQPGPRPVDPLADDPERLPVALPAEAPFEVGAEPGEGPAHPRNAAPVVVGNAGLLVRDGDRLLQALDDVAVAAQDVVGLDPHRSPGDLGGHAGMAVTIAPDPRPPAQVRLRDRIRFGATDGVLQRPVQPRGDGEQRLVEEDHRGAHLVERRRPLSAHGARLPQQADLLAKPSPQVAVLRAGQARIVEPIEQPIQPPLRHQHRAASRLGGVRGEHRHQAHAMRQRAHVIPRHAVAAEAEDRRADPIGQWRPPAGPLALARASEADASPRRG